MQAFYRCMLGGKATTTTGEPLLWQLLNCRSIRGPGLKAHIAAESQERSDRKGRRLVSMAN
jgi:hypothetical protein